MRNRAQYEGMRRTSRDAAHPWVIPLSPSSAWGHIDVLQAIVFITTRSVNEKTPLDKKTGENISFQKTKSGAGLQFLLLDCRARACTKETFLQTPV